MSSRPTEAEWHVTLARSMGENKAAAFIAAKKKAHPDRSIHLLSYGANGISSRNNVQRMVRLKCEQKGPPVYQYYFTWQHTGGADTGQEDGDGLDEFRPHGQSQPSRVNLDRHGSNTLSNDGVRQSLPDGGRSGGRVATNPAFLMADNSLPAPPLRDKYEFLRNFKFVEADAKGRCLHGRGNPVLRALDDFDSRLLAGFIA